MKNKLYNKKIKLDDLKLRGEEKIIKVFYPTWLLGWLFYFFDKRTSLIITDKRVILRGLFERFDKEVKLENVSDVLKRLSGFSKCLDVLERGKPAVAFGWLDEYAPRFSCGWLSPSELNEAYNLIKRKI
ncbi:MAG: hypothetical protein NTV36_02970 [Candidatus Staskawiczbacteria bacterium]|nr:hypothetical protein [Candidatus Staskawiczbacteria bacterium]